MESITLVTRINTRDFLKISFHLFYKKWSVRLWTAIAISLLLRAAITFDYPNLPLLQIILGVGILTIMPVRERIKAKRNFGSNPRMAEKLTYVFSDQVMAITGQSFRSEIPVNNIYKITESRNYVLVWQNEHAANALPKRDFKLDALDRFRDLMSKLGRPVQK